MIHLDIDQSALERSARLSQTIVEKMEKELNRFVQNREGTIAVSFVGEEEIRRLNRLYRGKDASTDVLSFGYPEVDAVTGLIGDVAICIQQAKRQAVDGDLELEFVDLIVHGALHTLGFDHETPGDAAEMFPKQDAIVQASL